MASTISAMSAECASCPCGRDFVAAGTIHGQPASLWALLEHQATDHTKGRDMTTISSIAIKRNERGTFRGRVVDVRTTNALDLMSNNIAHLPAGEAHVLLHLRLAEQSQRSAATGTPMTHDDLYRELIGAADSLDTHVDAETAAAALRAIADRLEADGLTAPEGDAA